MCLNRYKLRKWDQNSFVVDSCMVRDSLFHVQTPAACVGVLGWLRPMVEQSHPAKSTSSASDLLMKAWIWAEEKNVIIQTLDLLNISVLNNRKAINPEFSVFEQATRFGKPHRATGRAPHHYETSSTRNIALWRIPEELCLRSTYRGTLTPHCAVRMWLSP